jgi:predicted  nucleic acid-binding Zn-ribbon protein
VSPLLTTLIALQSLDTAADEARRRLAAMPAEEQASEAAVAAAREVADAVKARLTGNQDARRALEKDVAVVEARLARFDDHKAAVKTNHEYTALLHEIEIAKADKDSLEEKVLLLMEEQDALTAELRSAERALADDEARGRERRTALAAEQQQIDADLARLAAERRRASADVDARSLALYEQLLKGRRGVAVARLNGDICEACHVRLRPHVAQQVRRNDSVVQCDSCQRMLYFIVPAPPPAA